MSRLFVFTENYARGGGNKYLIDLVNAVVPKYEDIIVASNQNGFYPEERRQFNQGIRFKTILFFTAPMFLSKLGLLTSRHLAVNLIRLIFLLLDPILMLINVLVFSMVLLLIRPDRVLCANGGFPAARACLAMVFAARLLSLPVHLSIVSMPTPRRSAMKLYEKLLDWLTWHSVSTVIVNAHEIATQLANLRGMPLKKSKVVHNGLPSISSPMESKSHNKSLVIGCIARMDAAKGVFYLFNAFEALVKVYPSLKLILVGAGDGSVKLQQMVAEKGLQDQVTLTGHFSGDVSQLLSTFDIFAFPSLWEGFPYSILEAMRSGLAIVSTNVGGIPEAITDGENGLLVLPASTEALIEALERVVSDSDLRIRLAKSARVKFEQDFSLNQMSIATRQLL